MPARCTTSLRTSDPSTTGCTSLSFPLRRPIGVRTASTITTSRIFQRASNNESESSVSSHRELPGDSIFFAVDLPIGSCYLSRRPKRLSTVNLRIPTVEQVEGGEQAGMETEKRVGDLRI